MITIQFAICFDLMTLCPYIMMSLNMSLNPTIVKFSGCNSSLQTYHIQGLCGGVAKDGQCSVNEKIYEKFCARTETPVNS